MRNHVMQKGGLRVLVDEIRQLINDEIKDGNFTTIVELTSMAELPNVGAPNILYIVQTNAGIVLYRWNQQALIYNIIGTNYNNIQIIRGGNAT